MPVTREDLVQALPVSVGELELRLMQREDMYERAQWPLYPSAYAAFNGSHAGMSREELDAVYDVRNSDPGRLMMVGDHPSEPVIVYFSLNEVDWNAGVVGNLGLRVKPAWCDRGIGTAVMRAVTDWLFEHGFSSVRFDVSAANLRAVRCYEKCGFKRVGESWRDDESFLRSIDLEDMRYDFLRPHVRFDGDMPQVRFWWMELVNDGSSD